MKPRSSRRRGALQEVAALAVLAGGDLAGFTELAAAKSEPAKLRPKEVIMEWKKAGADVGWMRVRSSGCLECLPEEEGVTDELPAFRFSAWKEGLLAKLPAPKEAFGLDLT